MLTKQAIIERIDSHLRNSPKRIQYKNMSSDIKNSISIDGFRKLVKQRYAINRYHKINSSGNKSIDRTLQNLKVPECKDKRKFTVIRHISDGTKYEVDTVKTYNKVGYILYLKRVILGMKSYCTQSGIDFRTYLQENLSINKSDSLILMDLRSVRYTIGIDNFPIELESSCIRHVEKYTFNPYEKYGFNTVESEDVANLLLF